MWNGRCEASLTLVLPPPLLGAVVLFVAFGVGVYSVIISRFVTLRVSFAGLLSLKLLLLAGLSATGHGGCGGGDRGWLDHGVFVQGCSPTHC